MQISYNDTLDALAAYVRQCPGFESANYEDPRQYRRDYRPVLQHLHDAERMLAFLRWQEGITTDDLIRASRLAYSGRLKISADDNGQPVIDYMAGQYPPTKYRAAVCAVLSAALWDHWHKDMGPGSGSALRRKAIAEFGVGLARRWF